MGREAWRAIATDHFDIDQQQGLTRLSQRTAWQDGRFALDRTASRLLATVH